MNITQDKDRQERRGPLAQLPLRIQSLPYTSGFNGQDWIERITEDLLIWELGSLCQDSLVDRRLIKRAEKCKSWYNSKK